MHTIKQRRLFTKREYNILDNKLHYNTSYIGGESEGIITFENLSKEKTTFKSKNSIILLVSVLLFGLAGISFLFRNDKDVDPFMWIGWTVVATIILTVHIVMSEVSWKIKTFDKGYIYIFKKKPDENSVENFISTLFEERDAYLRKTYLSLDSNLSYENQLNDLKWLRNIEAISKEEFDKYYSDLKLLYSPQKGTIGFER